VSSHADAAAILLERRSRQEALWGGNYYPGLGEGECVEYKSLIIMLTVALERETHARDSVG
jgi:hypothetical protein